MFCTECGKEQLGNPTFCRNCGAKLAVGPTIWNGPATVEAVEYAGFWRRFAAFLIDWLLIFVISFVIGIVVGIVMIALMGSEDNEALTVIATVLDYTVGLVISWIYFASQESSSAQATLGKRALGIIVTDLDGKRVSFGRATGRFFGRIVSALILWIGFLMIAFTERKQGLHDLIANCLVVRKK
ncbi:MAG: RDD family protein [Dehalococcoidia bacterium]|nr:RDD family protein [Dehalococcoidia bacterium]